MAERPLAEWADRLEVVCAACPGLGVRHVRVVAETASTQDAAWAACGGSAGWLVVAGRQVGGRGRLGRAWAATGDLGLAMTMTLPDGRVSSVGVGVAVCGAVQLWVAGAGRHGSLGCSSRGRGTRDESGAAVGLRWPNDVVERASGRKVAGVLIEARDGVALVGIGVNVGQGAGDYPDGLRGRAVSVRELGGATDRLGVACEIVRELERIAGADAHAVAREAMVLDTIVRTRRRFVCDGREYAGEVVGIGADGSIEVALGSGVVSLPAATTSLTHE